MYPGELLDKKVISKLFNSSETCINSSSLCDGRRDCLDGVDEVQCVNIDMNGASQGDDSLLSPQSPILSSSDLRLQPIPEKTGYLKVQLLTLGGYFYCRWYNLA